MWDEGRLNLEGETFVKFDITFHLNYGGQGREGAAPADPSSPRHGLPVERDYQNAN